MTDSELKSTITDTDLWFATLGGKNPWLDFH